jgi:homoserine kinase type II
VARSADSWHVTVGDQQYVATRSPLTERDRIVAGLAVTEHLSAAGIAAASPVRTADGGLAATLDGDLLALVHEVPGRALSGVDPLDQQWWGDLLGTAHQRLAGFRHPRLARFAWLDPAAPHLAVANGIRPAVAAARHAATRLTVTDQLTYGVLHGDPAPESFRIDPATGRSGLTGWPAPAIGPLAYDVAAAAGYAGGLARSVELVDGYLAAGPVPREEMEVALPILMRYRLAERVDRYARRVAGPDVTEADRAGLADARAALTAWPPAGPEGSAG